MAKAKRARRNSFRTMSDDGALEALEKIERVVVDEKSERGDEPDDDDTSNDATKEEPS